MPQDPAATQSATASGGTGSPCGTDVGLADQIGDLRGGGLAGQAGEGPAAVATGEDFGLAIRQKFELGHLNVRSKLKWASPNGVLAASQSLANSSSVLQHCDSDVLSHLLRPFSAKCPFHCSGSDYPRSIWLGAFFMSCEPGISSDAACKHSLRTSFLCSFRALRLRLICF